MTTKTTAGEPAKAARDKGAANGPTNATGGNRPLWPHPDSRVAQALRAQTTFPGAVAMEHFMDSAAQVQAELARFGAERVHEAMRAQEEMLGCRTLGDVRSAQVDYLKGMTRDYMREWLRLMEYGLQISGGHAIRPNDGGASSCRSVPV